MPGDLRRMVAGGAFPGGLLEIRNILYNEVELMTECGMDGVEFGLHRLDGPDQALPEVFDLVEFYETAQSCGRIPDVYGDEPGAQSGEQEHDEQREDYFPLH